MPRVPSTKAVSLSRGVRHVHALPNGIFKDYPDVIDIVLDLSENATRP